MLMLPLKSTVLERDLGRQVAGLFGAGEQGGWYDVSDMSTLFQDAAGATPVTAVGQPVGRILDKSGRGNHATQVTTTKRPVYSRRVNELLATTTLATQSVTTRAAPYRLVFSGAGSVTLSGTASGVYGAGTHSVTCTAGSLTLTVSGTVQDASLTLATDAHLSYQWVNTATDYDADPAKFPAYLRFDAVDDALKTGNIDFTATNKMTVLAGYAKLNDGPTSVFLETGVNYTGGGGIGMFPSDGGSTNFGIAHSDPSGNKVASIVSAATEVGVVTVRYDLQAGEKTSIRKDSGAWSFAAASGGGMLGNRPLHIGARSGTSLFFNGRLYSLIVRGAQTPLSQIQTVESYIKQKMRLP